MRTFPLGPSGLNFLLRLSQVTPGSAKFSQLTERGVGWRVHFLLENFGLGSGDVPALKSGKSEAWEGKRQLQRMASREEERER